MKKRKASTNDRLGSLLPDNPEEFVGFHQDLVIEKFGAPKSVRVLGKDDYGMVVKWFYKDFIFIFGKATDTDKISKKPVSVYVVTKVERRRSGRHK